MLDKWKEMPIEELRCKVCGGFLDEKLKCKYCGTLHRRIVDDNQKSGMEIAVEILKRRELLKEKKHTVFENEW